MPRSRAEGLHGSAPDRCEVALLLIDWINDLEFGSGDIDFPPVLAALGTAGYRGLVAVELPRHSHAAPAVPSGSQSGLKAV